MGRTKNVAKRRLARKRNKKKKWEMERQQHRINAELRQGKTDKVRMCTSKKSYLSQNTAIEAAIKTSFKYGHPMRPYKCPHCKNWHVTKNISKEFQGENND